jgi:hypothetical protein
MAFPHAAHELGVKRLGSNAFPLRVLIAPDYWIVVDSVIPEI